MIEYIEDACIHIKIYQGINNGRLGCASGTFRLGVRDSHIHVLFYTAPNIASVDADGNQCPVPGISAVLDMCTFLHVQLCKYT